MTKLATLTLTGASGREYTFNVYPINTKFAEVAAVYAVTKRYEKADGRWTHNRIVRRPDRQFARALRRPSQSALLHTPRRELRLRPSGRQRSIPARERSGLDRGVRSAL